METPMAHTPVHTVLMHKSGIQASFGTAAGLLGFVSILAQLRYIHDSSYAFLLPLSQTVKCVQAHCLIPYRSCHPLYKWEKMNLSMRWNEWPHRWFFLFMMITHWSCIRQTYRQTAYTFIIVALVYLLIITATAAGTTTRETDGGNHPTSTKKYRFCLLV